ncbi:ABC transporter ATP-binding protein [Telmatospirillum sp. J64-1]|uniref:ABC transporter ATP-binding protein n=1 Tax=Telmatospirillum sp. J64-1 TaxID=2502183 RepID=UPI00115D8338|nr:ABC transporter ATP-binding protein [Telmatospirillum sp. J64-1]
MASVSIENVSKDFGAIRAVDGVSMEIASGQFVALLGPSGCGKTTLLRLLAGFEQPDMGSIRIDDDVVSGEGIHLPPEDRRIGMVFQSYALWPHMSVAENVAYALKVQRIGRAEREKIVASALETVGLKGMEERRPSDLSGGQRQRVALARCLAMSPRLVLLDEPLSNLDVHLREAMQAEFKSFHRQTGATMVYVTHDQAEALALADRVAVVMRGRLRQFDAPEALYRRPVDAEVARFIGAGMVVRGRIVGMVDDRHCQAELLGVKVTLSCTGRPSGMADICLRPEDLRLATGNETSLPARVIGTTYRGAWHSLEVAPQMFPDDVLHLQHAGRPPSVGDLVRVAIGSGWVLPQG